MQSLSPSLFQSHMISEMKARAEFVRDGPPEEEERSSDVSVNLCGMHLSFIRLEMANVKLVILRQEAPIFIRPLRQDNLLFVMTLKF